MLTADLVHVRRRGDLLQVVAMPPAERPRARELAATMLALVGAHVGLARGALLEAWNQVAIAPSENRLARALWKLALDACEFEAGAELDPTEIRREVFLRAAAVRGSGRDFDRAAVFGEIAQGRGVGVEAVDAALYSDLPSAHILVRAALPSPDALLARHELASQQAVLLRAVHVRARVFHAGPAGYRALLRKLKFHRLLYTVTKLERGEGYLIDIDGPFSMFEQTTKYGLKLALALPAIMACDTWDVSAELRWGKDRRPLRYHVRGGAADGPGHTTVDATGPDEVATLLSDLRQLASAWQVSPSDAILDLPGVGVCVPDLAFVHRKSGATVFLEVLGFWSRAAVWKRVDMVQSGMPAPIIFAVSKHLRVSEEVIPADAPAALYVYARTMNARAVLERVEAVAALARR